MALSHSESMANALLFPGARLQWFSHTYDEQGVSKRAIDKAQAAHQLNNGSLMVSRELVDRKRVYGVLLNPQDAPATLRNCHMYEMLAGLPVRLYFDLDFYKDGHPS